MLAFFPALFSKWKRGADYPEIMAAKRGDGNRRAKGSPLAANTSVEFLRSYLKSEELFLPRFLQRESKLGLNCVGLQTLGDQGRVI